MKESTPMTTSTPQAPMVILDEAGYYFGGHNDSLKEDLRKIDGVPNATYSARSQDTSTIRTRPKRSGNGLPMPCCATMRWIPPLPSDGQRPCTTVPSPA